MVLFGGYTNGGPANDTWEYDGDTWIRRQPTLSPSSRFRHHLAYDPLRGKTVLYGGYIRSPFYGDTWEWDGSTWTECISSAFPPPRVMGGFTFDASRGVIFLFGGAGPIGYLNDCWDWDGLFWRQRRPSVSPPPRWFPVLKYDAARGRSLLVGGTDGTEVFNAAWTLHDVRLDAAPTMPAPGATVTLSLRSAADPGLLYCAAASLSTSPGIPLPNDRYLGLTPDALFFLSICANGPIFEAFGGYLDANGAASFRLHLPPDPVLLGLAVHVAAVTVGPAGVKGLANVVTLRVL